MHLWQLKIVNLAITSNNKFDKLLRNFKWISRQMAIVFITSEYGNLVPDIQHNCVSYIKINKIIWWKSK